MHLSNRFVKHTSLFFLIVTLIILYSCATSKTNIKDDNKEQGIIAEQTIVEHSPQTSISAENVETSDVKEADKSTVPAQNEDVTLSLPVAEQESNQPTIQDEPAPVEPSSSPQQTEKQTITSQQVQTPPAKTSEQTVEPNEATPEPSEPTAQTAEPTQDQLTPIQPSEPEEQVQEQLTPVQSSEPAEQAQEQEVTKPKKVVLLEPTFKNVRIYPLEVQKVGTIFTSVEENVFEKNRAAMLYLSIQNASNEELANIAKMSGAPSSSKDAILKHLNIVVEDVSTSDNKTEKGEAAATKVTGGGFNIQNADTIERRTINKTDFVFIDGNVKIEFRASDLSRVLSADSILFDVTENEIIAFGNISISSSTGESQLQNLKSQGLYLNLSNNKIYLYEAYGSTKKDSSSYYMTGEQITLDSKSAELYFKNGALQTTSNRHNSNWSITSRNIVMKSNGDMFMNGILLKIGRVPILPLPALFMPGNPLVYNPSIGFVSDKGAFINTTYELYGKYPSLGKAGEAGSSFTSLLKTSSDSNVVKKGLLYEPSDKVQKSGSDYMALFADVYQNSGLFAGLETSNKFKNGKISLNIVGGFAYQPLRKPTFISSSTYKSFRYTLQSDFSYSKDTLKISLTLPFYSDPTVRSTYLNRFTAFSFDSLLMGKQEFPTTYSTSSQNEFTWQGELSYSLPSKKRTKLLSEFSIKASMNHSRYWTRDSSKTNEYYTYNASTTNLPSATMNANGTIFSYNYNPKVSTTQTAETSKTYNLPKNATYSQYLKYTLLNERNASSNENKNQEPTKEETNNVDKAAPNSDLEDNIASDSEKENVLPNFADLFGFSAVNLETQQDETEATGDTVNNNPDSNVADDKTIVNESETKQAIQDFIKDSLDVKNAQDEDVEYKNEIERFTNKRRTATANYKTKTTNVSKLAGSAASLKWSLSDTFSNVFARPEKIKEFFGTKKISNSASGQLTLQGNVGKNYFNFNQNIKPVYTYSLQESSNNLQTHDLSVTSSINATAPFIGLGYNVSFQIYSLKSTKDDKTAKKVTHNLIKFDKEHISSHTMSYSKTFGKMSLSISGTLPPISLAFNPSVSIRLKKASISLRQSVKGDNFSKLDLYQTDGTFDFNLPHGSTGFTASYNWEDARKTNNFFHPLKVTERLSLNYLRSWIIFSQNLTYYAKNTTGEENYLQTLYFKLSTKNEYASIILNMNGVISNIKVNSTKLKFTVPTFYKGFWKNRIQIQMGFSTGWNLDLKDAFQNSMDYLMNFRFEIKEFISLDFSLGGANNNFTKYTGGNRYGAFRFGEFIGDILRGINILNPNDMVTSNFKMSRMNANITHDMGDWDLRFGFEGNFELSGNEYKFTPKYSITLKWKAIPELKVDKTIKP